MKFISFVLLVGLFLVTLGMSSAHSDPMLAPSLPDGSNSGAPLNAGAPPSDIEAPSLVSENVSVDADAPGITLRHHHRRATADDNATKPSRSRHRSHRSKDDDTTYSAITSVADSTDLNDRDKNAVFQGAVIHHNISHKRQIMAPTPAVSLDSMTRDGSTPASAPAGADGQKMNIGDVIFRWIIALVLVLALIVSTIYVLRKKGYGATDQDEFGEQLSATTKTPFGTNPWAAMIVRQAAAASKRKINATQNRSAANSKGDRLTDMEVLGSQELPGTGSRLVKVRIGDRILLLGSGSGGALSVLTEWDVENKPEDEQRFEDILDQMTSPALPQRPPREPALTTAGRLNETLQRLSTIGESTDQAR